MRRIIINSLFLMAAGLLLACSAGDVYQAARIASTGSLASVPRYAAEKAVGYALNPKAFERDLKRFASVLKAFRRAVGGEWGEEEIKVPRPKEYIKYTQNYLSRASVDFDAGLITVETVDQENPRKSLKNAIVTTLLTPDDPRAVDLYSAGEVKLGDEPFLYREVKDHEGRDIRWAWRAERFADHLLADSIQTREVKAGGRLKTVTYVLIGMVGDHHHVRAAKYRPLVERFAGEFGLSRNLLYAVIRTESDFNPYAVSAAPAFGLMQIVPQSAGRDVEKFLNRSDGIPSREFLFVPENNIRYGAAYLHLLMNKYLDGVADPLSREYCAIAAYNTGSGNVLRTFDRDRSRALSAINALPPLGLYQTLREKLPYAETRDYLAKVLDAKKDFVAF